MKKVVSLFALIASLAICNIVGAQSSADSSTKNISILVKGPDDEKYEKTFQIDLEHFLSVASLPENGKTNLLLHHLKRAKSISLVIGEPVEVKHALDSKIVEYPIVCHINATCFELKDGKEVKYGSIAIVTKCKDESIEKNSELIFEVHHKLGNIDNIVDITLALNDELKKYIIAKLSDNMDPLMNLSPTGK